ncbi:MAG TPA: hypothetical protein VIC27_12135, partial [Ktedonobacterales bacterium]
MRREVSDILAADLPVTTPRMRAAHPPTPIPDDQPTGMLAAPWRLTAAALLLALAVRIWFVVNSHGMMDGDEASLGFQADGIVRGIFPIYFPGSTYSGSWDAYLLAPLIALFGPSAWATRAVEGIEYLALVPLMGTLAARLFGERARLPALLLTALPPVYVAVTELRMLSGYIETLLIGTILALLALSVTDRWRSEGQPVRGQSVWRGAWRWALGAFLIGLGLWIDTLVIAFVVGVGLWLAPLAFARLRSAWRRSSGEALTRIACVGGLALMAFIIGWAPALFSPLTWRGGNPMLPVAASGAHSVSNGRLKNPVGLLGHIPHGLLTRLHF